MPSVQEANREIARRFVEEVFNAGNARARHLREQYRADTT